jgi:hypothetical protein
MLKAISFYGSLVVLAVATHVMTATWIVAQQPHPGYAVPLCKLVINTLTCSYNPGTDNCYYTIDMDCDGHGSLGCTQCYMVHLWRQDVSGNWVIVSVNCYNAPLDCGGNLNVNSGLSPLYGPGPYWFQVDVYDGTCNGNGGLLDSTWTTFTRN